MNTIMNTVIGIFDGTHDAGACIIKDGTVIAACDEERLTRIKSQGGFPKKSVEWCLQHTGLRWSEIDHVAMAGLINPNPGLRLFRKQQKHWQLDNGQFYAPNQWWSNWLQFHSPFPKLQYTNTLVWSQYKGLMERRLSKQMKHLFQDHIPSVELYDHHHSHAASAYFTSGQANALVVVADGVGDGIALSIWTGDAQTHALQKRLDIPFPHSLGLLYASFTGYLGYKPFRHEGKLTGLSAHGDATEIKVKNPFKGPFPHRRLIPNLPLYDWLKQFEEYSPANIAAWLQRVIEQEMLGVLGWAHTQFGNRPLVMAGGLMANVALNQTIVETIAPPDFFVFPNMGDAGLAVGAGYLSGHKHFQWTPSKIPSVYWGPKIEAHGPLQNKSVSIGEPLAVSKLLDLALEALYQRQIVARAVGRMEYGPRALGRRSILCSANDPTINDKLNRLLNRSDIMPFAPIMRGETASQWLEIPDASWTAMEWMTITVQAKAAFVERCPAVVHVDGSLRPQLVYRDKHPVLWELLARFEKKTGEPALINTSFNRHEEPIVCTANDAIQAFLESNLDALWLENYWIERKDA